MERVYEVLTDPYISGIIVFIITWPLSNWLTKRVNKSEYYKRVNSANSQIIELLTDYIISFKNVDKTVIEEIIYAVSLESNVNVKDLYNINQIRAVLVKEIINIKLIPQEQRKEIIELIISNLGNDKVEETTEKVTALSLASELKSETKAETIILTTMMAFIVALIWLVIGREMFFVLNRNDSIVVIVMIAVVIITIILLVFAMQISYFVLNRKKELKKQPHKDRA
ncbi:MAG: hypothetical protein C0P72_004665 [Clostridia bacterium]|nr:hypothetical protein [Clostridia bacterium]PZN10944.1 MAG: hypothetical protein DIU64_04320 [Caldicoprobacter oshimai]